jgi:hypothetical protein
MIKLTKRSVRMDFESTYSPMIIFLLSGISTRGRKSTRHLQSSRKTVFFFVSHHNSGKILLTLNCSHFNAASGWDPNDNFFSTATSLSGPWSSWTKFADSGSHTYASQTTFVLPVGNNFMYMGDRWFGDALPRSTYVWLPLQISGTTATMKNSVNWVINAQTGAMNAGPSENQYEGESAALSNKARSISCSQCSNSNAAGYIGGPDQGAVAFANVNSDATTRTTIRVKHLNGDSSERYADVTVNGKTQRLAFLPHGGGDPASSVLHADLKQGSNSIKISMTGTYGPDVDRLLVPKS